MEIPSQTVQFTGFTEVTPNKRTHLLFTPLLNEQGQLADLKLYTLGDIVTSSDQSGKSATYLSDWMSPQVIPYLGALWRSLETGLPCSLIYQLTPTTSGQAMVTPINGGYLVEFLPPDPTLSANPLSELRRVQLQSGERQWLNMSFLQALYQRVCFKQAIIYTLNDTQQALQPQSQWVAEKLRKPMPITGVMLEEQQVILCQHLELNTPGIASVFDLFNEGYRSFMMVPLLREKQLQGALLVAHEQAHFFTSPIQKLIEQTVAEWIDSPPPSLPPASTLLPPGKPTHQMLEAILSNTPVGLALFQPLKQRDEIVDFLYLLTNPANATLTGHHMAEMVGKTLKTLFHGMVRMGLFERLVNVAQSGIPQQYQEQAEFDGVSMWGRFSLVRVGENVLFTIMDISDLKQTQVLLDLKNAQLEKSVVARSKQIHNLTVLQNAILKHGGQAIISTSTDAVIQTANQACEKLLGYSTQELLGKVVQVRPGTTDSPYPVISFQSVQRANAPTAAAFLQQTLNGEEYRYLEGAAITKMSTTVPILLAAIALQDEQGVTIGYLGIASNISALKTAQERLRQKDQELSTFFENALDMHCISDSEGVISKVNKAFQAVLGYSAAELKAIPFLQLIHPDEQKWVYQHRLKPILQQPVRNQINQMRCKDGTYRIIEWNAIAIEQVVYGSAHDITERQQAELNLRSLTQRLQLATQAAGQGIWENDIKAHTLLWDDRLWQLYGLEPRPAGWSFQEFIKLIHPDDLPAFLEKAQQERFTTRITNVFRIIRSDGAIRFIETSGLVLLDEQGYPARTVGVAWDVTERKLAEEALRESEARFREIADNVDEVFWIHAAQSFELLYINSAYERLFGSIAWQPLAKMNTFLDAVLEEDRAVVLVELDKYQHGQEVMFQCRIRDLHQAIRWLDIRTFVINNIQGVPLRYIGIANDISNQKEKELVLQQSLKREQELNQLKSQFVSTVSHQFRTPLTTIQTSTELIEMYLDVPTGQSAIRQHTGVICKEIERVNELLSDMLTIGKIEAGRVSFSPRWLDPVALCQELLATHYSSRSDQRKVQFERVGAPYQAYLDEKLMSHILINLVSNAFKFSAQNPRLTIRFLKDELRIEVADSGIGIPTQDMTNLFQAFFRASNTIGIPGTGLGLVIARQYVELHSGSLTVKSKNKKGTTFIICLPHKHKEVLPTGRLQ